MPIPQIDERVRYAGTSKLRELNTSTLREFQGALVIQDNDEPLVVIVPYADYIKLQSVAGLGPERTRRSR